MAWQALAICAVVLLVTVAATFAVTRWLTLVECEDEVMRAIFQRDEAIRHLNSMKNGQDAAEMPDDETRQRQIRMARLVKLARIEDGLDPDCD